MSTIIAGHLQLQDDIADARLALLNAGFEASRVSSFYVNPPGQHDVYELGGDHDKSPGAKDTDEGVVKGGATGAVAGAVVGSAAIPIAGPLGPVVGALVGAHVGSLYSLHETKERGEPEDDGSNVRPPRKAGMMIAVAVDDTAQEQLALEVLHRHGARDIERAQGTIASGDWSDFNPNSVPVPA
ncbi:glycine zipper domain-containing protein [Duganella callida]|uniref:Glycine zipper domain-containing protein n=1 Tax=Duganella callida TaxID=2561932 RepID=A0A4Y9STS0_9BURK|nr:glycine zipper domain-containing protein [Duganella callida]TFW28634.1 hypothetical protein E4L98_05420 [Duganella callida]